MSVKSNAKKLNKMDAKILRILQENGRIPFAELAREVGLTTSPCLERVRRMEREGLIKGYSALLDASQLNCNLVVFVQVRLTRKSQDIFNDFKRAAIALNEIQECYLVSGNFDYLIKARVADMDAYRTLLGETLLTLPGVQASTSYVVMEQVKETLNLQVL